MKPGLKEGAAASIHLTVRTRDVCAIRGSDCPPALFHSQHGLLYGMGIKKSNPPIFRRERRRYAVTVKHLAPAAEGSILNVTAEVVRLERNLIFTSVKAFHGDTVIGKGQVTQAILPRSKIKRFTEKIRLD